MHANQENTRKRENPQKTLFIVEHQARIVCPETDNGSRYEREHDQACFRNSQEESAPWKVRIQETDHGTTFSFFVFLRPIFCLLIDAVILVRIIHAIEFRSLVQHDPEPFRIIQISHAHLESFDWSHAFADYEERPVYQS